MLGSSSSDCMSELLKELGLLVDLLLLLLL